MIVPVTVRQLFDDARPYVVELDKRVTESVFSYCMREGFAFSARPKTIESVAEKIETGRYRRWKDIDDLFACTIVIPTLRDEDKVIEFLSTAFFRINVRGRNDTRKPPDAFRFEATRFIGRLHRPHGADAREPLFLLPFEVQIRSAFEHAWSTATHALVYKSPTVDWKRIRLAAQLKAAVEQLDSLILMFEESVQGIANRHWPEISARQMIAEFYSEQVTTGKIPRELAPKDWSRFAENVWGLLRAANDVSENRVERYTFDALEIIRAELDMIPPEKIPRSISIFQFTLGILKKGNLIGGSLYKFYPMITPDLISLYPEVNEIRDRFELLSHG
jgi:ppGpp synthetase/RelA/SpoT-type nucleotidyltranferase